MTEKSCDNCRHQGSNYDVRCRECDTVFSDTGKYYTLWQAKEDAIIHNSQAPTDPLAVQVDGDHYKTMKVQPVEYIHANNLSFIEGCVIKYVTRHKNKNGAKDIHKAIHFLQLLLKLEYGEEA
jgi:hypothetical protein